MFCSYTLVPPNCLAISLNFTEVVGFKDSTYLLKYNLKAAVVGQWNFADIFLWLANGMQTS